MQAQPTGTTSTAVIKQNMAKSRTQTNSTTPPLQNNQIRQNGVSQIGEWADPGNSPAEHEHSRHDDDGWRNRRKSGDHMDNAREASEAEIWHFSTYLIFPRFGGFPQMKSIPGVDTSRCGRSRGEVENLGKDSRRVAQNVSGQ